VKELGVELYSTENEEKSSMVERWNRTMIEKMFKYFMANNTNKYIDCDGFDASGCLRLH